MERRELKFYIATGLERAPEHQALAALLRQKGHQITYDWTVHGSVQEQGSARMAEVAGAEINGVQVADVVVVLLPGGRGTHAELGIALGTENVRVVYIVGERKGVNGHECAFYHATKVRRIADIEHLLFDLARFEAEI